MEQLVAWIATAFGGLVLWLLLDVFVLGFLEAIFTTRWGKRGQRMTARLREKNPDALTFLVGPRPGTTGDWYQVVIDERGLRALTATGREAWSDPWGEILAVRERFGELVIDRRTGGPRLLSPHREPDLAGLAQRISGERP